MTDQAPELKPCPFCGCTDILNKDDGDFEWMECDYCGSTSGHDEAFPERTAQEQWNTRADLAVKVKPLPRGNGKLPWELDWTFLDKLHKEANSYEDGSASHVAVEAIALAVERRILSALEGGAGMTEPTYCYGCEMPDRDCICKYAGLGDNSLHETQTIPQIDTSAEAVEQACTGLCVYEDTFRDVINNGSDDAQRIMEARYLLIDLAAERDALQAEVERLRESLVGLEKAATVAINMGAQTGGHWSKLTAANLKARAAMKGGA